MARIFRLPARLGLDATMTLLFITALAFRSTGRLFHEWNGVAFILLFVLHTAINLQWYKTLLKGRWGMRRILNTTTNIALLISMTAVFVTGVLNSRHIFGFSQVFNGENLRANHSLAAYWSLVFIGIHTGLHWGMVRTAFRKVTQSVERTAFHRIPSRLLALLIAFGGVWASFDRLMGSKLFLGFSFDFWDPSRPLVLFYGANLAILGLYACAAHYAHKYLFSASCRSHFSQSNLN